jgi:radical SAM superfamily enzyme YgiQ (UPF0313 family)
MNYNSEVLLIYANFTSKSLHPPLGLAYIAACLKEEGISVDILDCSFFSSYDEFSEIYKNYNPRIVGLSFLSSMTKGAFEVAERVKKENQKTFVVAGGPHATVFREKCLGEKSIDAIVIGEGEITFVELVKAHKLGSLRGVKGVYFKRGGQIIKNELREPLLDLNELPMPAYQLLPKEYFGERFSIITSRGCPFQCNYCQPTQRMIFGTRCKFESSNKIIDAINYLVDNWQIPYLIFEDDTFTIMEKRVQEICDAIIKNNLDKKMRFRCHVRAKPFPSDITLIKMRKAGFTNVSVGFESGDQRILNFLNKGTTVADNIQAGLTLRKKGFRVFAYIMIGAPGEDKKSLKNTLKMIKVIKPFEVRVSLTTPLPGTKLEEYCRKNNILNKSISEEERYHYNSFEQLPVKINVSKDTLLKYKRRIENYVRIRRILSNIKENPLTIFKYFRIAFNKFIK